MKISRSKKMPEKTQKPIHIRASSDKISRNIIAVGDPWRVKLLSTLLKDPEIVNEHRGFLIVTGYYGDQKITLATHGVGMPSAAIVFEELIMLGAEKIVRLGTTGSLREDIDIGDVIVAEGAVYNMGGTIGMYLENYVAYSATNDLELTYLLYKELKRRINRVFRGLVFSSDAFYAEDPNFVKRWSERNILSVEMECAVLAVIGRLRDVKTSCVLVVSDNLIKGVSILSSTERLSERFLEVGRVIMDVLSST